MFKNSVRHVQRLCNFCACMYCIQLYYGYMHIFQVLHVIKPSIKIIFFSKGFLFDFVEITSIHARCEFRQNYKPRIGENFWPSPRVE